MGFAQRKTGALGVSRDYYTRALLVDPSHRGALSYMGELELQEGNFDAARVLRVRLNAVCPSGCEALSDLDAAFAAAGVALTS